MADDDYVYTGEPRGRVKDYPHAFQFEGCEIPIFYDESGVTEPHTVLRPQTTRLSVTIRSLTVPPGSHQ